MDNTLDYVAIGKRIRAARKRRKWSIDKLALLSNISRPHMGHIETGATKLSLSALVAIANALEVTADELLCDTLKCSKAVYENELSLQLANANTQQMKLVSELAKVVLRDEFIPRSRECSGWWTEKGKHKIVLRDKRKSCGGGCTNRLPPYQFALGVNGVTK